MASKNKDVRLEQRRVLEKKLELRLSKLAGQGVASEKTKSDPLVKNLKSQIRETNVRIAAFDKKTVKIEELKQAKEKKLAEKSLPKEAKVAPEKESKPKKKAAAGEKEPKKKPAEAAAGDAPKKPRKKKEEAPAE
ncbi:MAG: hypothetical protein Q8O28_02615 [Smithellaceae bacterium]|nr:hypothetical protein [Smithellaceae bacterium]